MGIFLTKNTRKKKKGPEGMALTEGVIACRVRGLPANRSRSQAGQADGLSEPARHFCKVFEWHGFNTAIAVHLSTVAKFQ